MTTAAPARALIPPARITLSGERAQLKTSMPVRAGTSLSSHRFHEISVAFRSPVAGPEALPTGNGVVQLAKKKVKRTSALDRKDKADRKRIVATMKNTVKIDDFHLDGDNHKLAAGREMKYHAITHRRFKNRKAYNTYAKNTGAVIPSGAKLIGISEPMLSRRGSISGTSMVGNEVAEYRVHSYPTSEALKHNKFGLRKQRYTEALANMSEPATNSVGTAVPTNAVLASSASIVFNKKMGKHQVVQPYHGQGLSGSGVDHRHDRSSDSKSLFAPTIEAANRRGRAPSATATYHSEGGAIGMMNQARGDDGLAKMNKVDNMHAMYTSRPNQICVNCGSAVASSVNQHGIASSGAGTAFGGQVAGITRPTSSSGAMARSTPADELDPDENMAEVEHLLRNTP